MQSKQFEPGDYVRFINEKQEGTISRILPSGNIIVDIEDGFPIEVTPREIVKVQQNLIEKSKTEKQTPLQAEADYVPLPQASDFRINNEIRLLVIPQHGKVTTGVLKTYLLNTSNADFLYSFSEFRNKNIMGIAAGQITSNSLRFLAEFRREDLIDKGRFILTGLLHTNKEQPPTPVIRKEFELPIPDLHQRFPHLLSEYAFTETLLIHSSQASTEENQSALYEKLKSEFNTTKKSNEPVKQSKPAKQSENEQRYLRQFGLSSGDVDLHIEELTTDFSGLTNAEMITIQLNHFRKELDKAILRRATSIIFIHGVGNGRLKTEIRRELKDANIKFRDADASRYGLGATEVLF